MARRRLQKGYLQKRVGKTKTVWVAQWREDELRDGKPIRKFKKEVLGTLADYPTRKLAQRELDRRLSSINSPDYRPRASITFEEFAKCWVDTVLPNLKPSTQASCKSHLVRHLLPAFGPCLLKDITPEILQRSMQQWKLSPKTVRNLVSTLRILWNSGVSWGYLENSHLFDRLVLPRRVKANTFAFSLEEVRRILEASTHISRLKKLHKQRGQPLLQHGTLPSSESCNNCNPLTLFLRLAVELGLRAGELCALRWEDVNLDEGFVQVRQSVWRGKFQQPKSQAAVRRCAISSDLSAALREYRSAWRPNQLRLLFATRNGTPWDANLVVKRQLRPLLDKLGIRRAGLHAFRHTNASMMNSLNVDMKTQQARLGHTDAKMTLDVYTHADPLADKATADKLGELLCQNKSDGVSSTPPSAPAGNRTLTERIVLTDGSAVSLPALLEGYGNA